MKRGRRAWVELAAAALASIAAVATVLVPDWIEVLFAVEPDGGAGWLEVAITAALIAVAVTLALAARLDWRRYRTAERRLPL